MDFTKFVDLVSTEEIYFCRSDLLGDPFEGSYPKIHHERRIDEIRKSGKDFIKEIELFTKLGIKYRKYVHINCWHMNENESAALWRLYLKSNEGVAIRSTRQRLGASFIDSELSVWSVPVQYIDYTSDDPPVPTRMAPFRYKRKSFEHEKELRSIIYSNIQDEVGNIIPPPEGIGIRVKADLNQLLETVYVAPTSPDWFYDLTKRICENYGVAAQVVRSSLSSESPVFI